MSDNYVPEPEVRRVIVRDARGAVTSVPEDKVPKGSKIIGMDVEPGVSEPFLARTVSEVVNPEVPADEADVKPDAEVDIEVTIDDDSADDDAPKKTGTRKK